MKGKYILIFSSIISIVSIIGGTVASIFLENAGLCLGSIFFSLLIYIISLGVVYSLDQ